MEFFDATFWATICLIIFLGVAIYLGLPKIIGKMLDDRIAAIVKELDDAKKLRADAEALLVEYEQKRKEAEAEAAEIVASAQADAQRMTAEASAALADLVTRRTRAVEERIAQAEKQALAEVRGRSTDVAVEAARLILAKQASTNGGQLVDKAIADVAGKLN